MIAPGIEERLQIAFLITTVEALLLAAVAGAYYLIVRRGIVRDDLTVVKVFLASWDVLGFAAIGVIFGIPMALLSVFVPGEPGTRLLIGGVVAFQVMTLFGLVAGAWRYLTLKAPPPETDSALESGSVRVDSNGKPIEPTFTYGKHTDIEWIAGLVVFTLLLSAAVIFMTTVGTLTLMAWAEPGFFAPQMTARLLKGSVNRPLGDGLLQLGVGLFALFGGAALIRHAWRRHIRTRPFSIDALGFHCFHRGKPWRFLPWKEVKAITKLRLQGSPFPRLEILIEGETSAILLEPHVSHFGRACRLISRHAREHGIEMRFVDKGPDTLKAQKKLLPRATYRALTRTGVVGTIFEL